MNKDINYYISKYNTLIKCIVFTFIIGFLAHSYMYYNNAISNDSLNEFITWNHIKEIKIERGRGLAIFYLFLSRGFITIPYLLGVLSLIYISLSLFLITKIFKIKSDITILTISVMMVLNISLIALTATYMHDLDVDMMALLMATLSVYILIKFKYGYILGIFPLAISIGLYQAYISFAIVLIIIKCILDLLENEDFKKVINFGMKSIVMIIGAGLFYMILLKLISIITGIGIIKGKYNSVGNISSIKLQDLLGYIIHTWTYTLSRFLNPPTILNKGLSILLQSLTIILTLIFIIKNIIKNKINNLSVLIIFGLLFILPIGMNISRILMRDFSHEIMHYSIYMFYILPVLMLDRTYNLKIGNGKIFKYTIFAILLVVMMGNFRLANKAYLIKDFEQDANLSLFTRILDDMNEIEEYKDGQTPVAFIGRPLNQIRRNQDFVINDITGMRRSFVPYYSYSERYQAYFNYILMTNTIFVSEEKIDEISDDKRAINMPVYPSKGSIKMIDGVLVVKLGEDLSDDYQ